MREETAKCASFLVIVILIVVIFVPAPVSSAFFNSAAGTRRALPVFPFLLLLEVIIIVQLRAGRGGDDFVKRQCVGFVKIVLSGRGFGGRSGFFLPLLFFLFTDPLCFLLSGLQDDFIKGNRIGLIQRLILRRSVIRSGSGGVLVEKISLKELFFKLLQLLLYFLLFLSVQSRSSGPFSVSDAMFQGRQIRA